MEEETKSLYETNQLEITEKKEETLQMAVGDEGNYELKINLQNLQAKNLTVTA